MGDYATRAAHECGKIVLFIGTQCKEWTPAQFGEAAQFAREHRVDSISPKRADGSIRWYGSPDHLRNERAAVLEHGVGYEPFAYLYGPKFGHRQVIDEATVLTEMMYANTEIDGGGSVTADLESEWDGQDLAAETLASLMRPTRGLLYLTTWADPLQHHFPVRNLAPCVNAWVPQDYDNWLAACEQQQIATGMSIRFAALDLSQEFGANNVTASARDMRLRGHLSLWLWEYEMAVSNPALLDSVVSAFLG